MAQFNFPSDILQALDALNTLNSGSTEPSATAPFMLWMDTSSTPAVLKQRNAGDTGWDVLLTASNTSFDDTTAQLGATDVQVAIEKIKESLDAILNKPADVPVGSINALAVSTVPAGWLECDGAAVSRTQYAALFALLGTKYGTGDGSTTFNLPDLRGEFIRGWDNGRGVDVSRVLGSAQAGEFEAHRHYSIDYNNGPHVDSHGKGPAASGLAISAAYGTSKLVLTGAEGGTENRPRNVALIYVIKY